LQRIDEVARARGLGGLSLETAEMAVANIRLYQRHGFEIVSRGRPTTGSTLISGSTWWCRFRPCHPERSEDDMPNASGDEVLPEDAIFTFELIGEFPQQLFYRRQSYLAPVVCAGDPVCGQGVGYSMAPAVA